MALDLLVGPGSLELSYQIGGADHVLAQPPHQIHGPRVHKRDREHQIIGRVLHGDGPVVGQE